MESLTITHSGENFVIEGNGVIGLALHELIDQRIDMIMRALDPFEAIVRLNRAYQEDFVLTVYMREGNDGVPEFSTQTEGYDNLAGAILFTGFMLDQGNEGKPVELENYLLEDGQPVDLESLLNQIDLESLLDQLLAEEGDDQQDAAS